MSTFFRDDNSIDLEDSLSYVDRGALRSHLDRISQSDLDRDTVQPMLAEAQIVSDSNGGVSNEYYLNDYRNRMPFHYIEEDGDGYYYWMYGATMVIDFIFEDLSLSVTDDTVSEVLDVKLNGRSVVDKDGVAHIIMGTMAAESADNYYTKEQTDDKTMALWNSLNARTAELTNRLVELDTIVQQRIVSTKFDLPTVGIPDMIYVSAEDHSIRVWDETDLKYVKVAADYEQISLINGGGAVLDEGVT